MTDIVAERVAWIHRDANQLTAINDLVELKYCLKTLIAETTAVHEIVKNELQRSRKLHFNNSNAPSGN